MPFISRDGLKKLLQTHCVEIKYQRRHSLQDSKTCRLFCVGCYPYFHTNKFLATIGAQSALGFEYPKGAVPYPPKPPYNPDAKNLVITFSIFDGNYRSISIYRANVIRAFPVDTKENIKNFWDYFNRKIAKMSIQEKTDFKKK
jgi:hypothetical protein